MKVATLTLCLATAAAFVPSKPLAAAPARAARASTTTMAVEDYLGADVETAGLWDPWGLSKNPDKLYRYRCVELKHGRIAMLATTGYLFAELFQFPGYLSPSTGLRAS